MNTFGFTHASPNVAQRQNNHRLPVLLLALLLLVTGTLRAGNVYVPNFSFESPSTDYAYPEVDSWQLNPQPGSFDPATFGPWYQLVGVFANTTNGDPDHIVNCDGSQLLFVFNYPQAGLFQDYNSIGGADSSPSHAFNAKFQPGKSYRLTVGITSSREEPLPQGSLLQLNLYYRDASSNMVVIASTNVMFDTNVFTNLDELVDFQVGVANVQASDLWANQNIGIQIQCVSSSPSGVWDIDNVRLTESIHVPNFSFESPTTDYAYPQVDSWQLNPQPDTFDSNIFGPWYQLVGVFANTTNGDPDHIVNCDGNQLLFLFNYPQAGLFQDYNSIGGADSSPSHAFNALYQPGKSYALTVGVTSSREEPLPQGSLLQLSLYYRDASSNMVTVASTIVSFDTNVFTDLNRLLDFTVTVPGVKATDPWANQNIGLQIQCDSSYPSGVWDVDNVRLVETVAPALSQPGLSNGQLHFTLLSEPGVAFDILSSPNIYQPMTNWVSIATVTNVAGAAQITAAATNATQRFYRARRL